MNKLLSMASGLVAIATQRPGTAKGPQKGDAFEFAFSALDGKPLPLDAYRGKVLLVVNTASRCGFTPQYEGLQRLWEKYRDRGLVVIGVPSNDFGGQEPGNAKQIGEFCDSRFGVTFPMSAKYPVKGPGAHPFYKWAAAATGGKGVPSWNFHKYLIARDGRLRRWFPSTTSPRSRRLEESIAAELDARP